MPILIIFGSMLGSAVSRVLLLVVIIMVLIGAISSKMNWGYHYKPVKAEVQHKEP